MTSGNAASPNDMSSQSAGNLQIRVGILIIILIGYSATSVTVSLAGVARSFPEIPTTTVMLLASVLAFSSTVSSLLAGPLQRWCTQKQVLLGGVSLMFLGVVPVFYSKSFLMMGAIIFLLGFGSGLLTATGPSYISNHFSGRARTSMLGLKMSVQGAGSVVFSLLAGILTVSGWQQGYLPFFLCGIAFFIGLFLLPRDRIVGECESVPQSSSDGAPRAADEKGSGSEERGMRAMSPFPLLIVLFTAVLCMSAMGAMAGLSLHIEFWNIGDSALSGLATALLSGGMILGGLAAPSICVKLRTKTMAIAFLVAAMSQIIMGLSRDPFTVCCGAFLFGCCYALIFTQCLTYLSGICRPSSVPLAMSLESGISSLGATFGVPIVNAFAGWYPWPAETSGFFTMTALLAIAAASLVLSGFERRISARVLECGGEAEQ